MLPIKYKDKFLIEIKRILKLGIISGINSVYSSPCFVTHKDNGDLRILIDYRKLNVITEPYDMHFPSVNNEIIHFKDAEVFSTLNI